MNIQHKGGFSDLDELPWYYPALGYSEEVLKVETDQSMVPNQDLPIITYQKVFS